MTERMRVNNPTADPDVLRRITEAAQGRKPAVAGGNGRPLTQPQLLLLALLPGWKPEHAIGVGIHIRARHGVDTRNYKVDLADIPTKTAVECDGGSHRSPKARERDARKGTILADLGWVVLHYTNAAILADLHGTADAIKAVQQARVFTT